MFHTCKRINAINILSRVVKTHFNKKKKFNLKTKVFYTKPSVKGVRVIVSDSDKTNKILCLCNYIY